MKLWGVLVVAACYAPHLEPGSPCDTGPCPAGLVCSPATLTCELEAAAAVNDASLASDSLVLIDGCTPAPEICGNGTDEDCDGVDAPCPANDAPGGAIDVSAGGTFTANVSAATNDANETGCGGDGGRDVFYSITLPTAEVIYLDTFGSNFGTSVRIYAGKTCGVIGGNPSCTHTSCGGTQAQIALQLPQGTSCIVVDQHAGDTHGALALNVKRGGRRGQPLQGGVQTATGDTCTGADNDSPDTTLAECQFSDDQDAKDQSYFFTVCPNATTKVDASTCADPSLTHFDTILYLHGWAKPQVACNDDGSTCAVRPDRPDHADGSILTNVAAAGPGPFWLVVDGFQNACGGYQLTTALH